MASSNDDFEIGRQRGLGWHWMGLIYSDAANIIIRTNVTGKMANFEC